MQGRENQITLALVKFKISSVANIIKLVIRADVRKIQTDTPESECLASN